MMSPDDIKACSLAKTDFMLQKGRQRRESGTGRKGPPNLEFNVHTVLLESPS